MKNVISCSRRTDVPRWYSPWLAQALRRGQVTVALPYGGERQVDLSPSSVHTLVLWSKDYRPLLDNQAGVRDALQPYEQLYAFITITGLGGGAMEPQAPRPSQALNQLPELIDLTGSPDRVSVRFDPIVMWKQGNVVRSNVDMANDIFASAAAHGVTRFRFSFATIYQKMRSRGVEWYDPPSGERREIVRRLLEMAAPFKVELYICAQEALGLEGIHQGRCIDGQLLASLHPRGEPASLLKDRGQRKLCGCTESIDIGAYSQVCWHSCLYCYAHPARWSQESRPGLEMDAVSSLTFDDQISKPE